MAAVVHHGGAGSTAAGLRAGVPSILVPHFADQPFWGRRVGALGVGPAAIPAPSLLRTNWLGRWIRPFPTRRCAKAAALGEKIRAEDGIGQAVVLIEEKL